MYWKGWEGRVGHDREGKIGRDAHHNTISRNAMAVCQSHRLPAEDCTSRLSTDQVPGEGIATITQSLGEREAVIVSYRGVVRGQRLEQVSSDCKDVSFPKRTCWRALHQKAQTVTSMLELLRCRGAIDSLCTVASGLTAGLTSIEISSSVYIPTFTFTCVDSVHYAPRLYHSRFPPPAAPYPRSLLHLHLHLLAFRDCRKRRTLTTQRRLLPSFHFRAVLALGHQTAIRVRRQGMPHCAFRS